MQNEDKEWDIREVVQRMACFLKERWKSTQPASMYKSKGKALDLYTNESTRDEFRKLYDVARDIVTLPEYVQSQFSLGDAVKGRKFGKMRAVKTLKRPSVRPGADYETEHEMDLAASLPIAAAFRELLELKGDRYYWRVDYKLVFQAAAEELYKALLNKLRSMRSLTSLGADTEYWTQASNIVLRAKDEVLSRGARVASEEKTSANEGREKASQPVEAQVKSLPSARAKQSKFDKFVASMAKLGIERADAERIFSEQQSRTSESSLLTGK